MAARIRTYDTEAFRRQYMQPEIDAILRGDVGRFLVVQVQEMYRLIQRPVPPMRAYSHTLIYLTEGTGSINIGSETHHFSKNECIVVPAGQIFSFGSDDVNEGYLCHFSNDMLGGKFGGNELLKEFPFLQVWGEPHLRPDTQTAAFVEHLFRRMLLEYDSKGLEQPDLLHAYLIALLQELKRAVRPASGTAKTQAVHLANRFRELLYAHLRERHRVSEYAALLHITPNHLNKAVRSTTGKSPTRWIDEALVLEAKVLLQQPDLSVGEIAAGLGFSDPSYFSRLFRKQEGISPLEFRRGIEKS